LCKIFLHFKLRAQLIKRLRKSIIDFLGNLATLAAAERTIEVEARLIELRVHMYDFANAFKFIV
jgi:hypothetical protein